MKESHSEGLAIHTGPESCGVVREDNVEALTGECAGRVFSRETYTLRNADALRVGGRHNRLRRYREALQSSARSQTPSTHRSTSRGNREIPRSPMAKDGLGRIGKSEDVRR
jgi:RNA-directed DNA polymerase